MANTLLYYPKADDTISAINDDTIVNDGQTASEIVADSLGDTNYRALEQATYGVTVASIELTGHDIHRLKEAGLIEEIPQGMFQNDAGQIVSAYQFADESKFSQLVGTGNLKISDDSNITSAQVGEQMILEGQAVIALDNNWNPQFATSLNDEHNLQQSVEGVAGAELLANPLALAELEVSVSKQIMDIKSDGLAEYNGTDNSLTQVHIESPAVPVAAPLIP